MGTTLSKRNFFQVKNQIVKPNVRQIQQTVALYGNKRRKPVDPDYQAFPKSKLPTAHFQHSLPRLPIPNLSETAERYMRAQRPLLDFIAYEKTRFAVESFIKSPDGNRCQSELVGEDMRNKHTSYISGPWFEMYLRDRKPLPINYNPCLVFSNDPNEGHNDQLVRATNLVISAIRFYKSLTEETLEPEVYHLNAAKSNTDFFRTVTGALPKSLRTYGAYLFKAYPLDMSQHKNLFNTTRVPEIDIDRIKYSPGKKHIMIMRNGYFYTLDCIDEDGNIAHPYFIMGVLKQIINATEKNPPDFPVGMLTTEDRNTWADIRKYLSNLGNSDVLEYIDTSLFNLVLDGGVVGSDPVRQARLFLHGDGVNRWFDKSFSLIVAADGTAGINFEHSWGDGVAVLRFFNDVYKDSVTKPRVTPKTPPDHNVLFRRLDFTLDNQMKTYIRNAQIKYQEKCESLEIRAIDYRRFGRNLCKPLSLSADAIMQLAFQIAYNQLTGQQAVTYESCSTSAFKHGRTETVRPCTIETKRVCDALQQHIHPERKEFQKLIMNCSSVHSRLIREAAMGQGFDRHLFALKLKAESLGLTPAIFTDPAYHNMNYNILSTSTLSSDNLQLGAFGPTVRNGFGIGYSIWSDRLGCLVTNYAGEANGSGFCDALELAFDKLEIILT